MSSAPVRRARRRFSIDPTTTITTTTENFEICKFSRRALTPKNRYKSGTRAIATTTTTATFNSSERILLVSERRTRAIAATFNSSERILLVSERRAAGRAEQSSSVA